MIDDVADGENRVRVARPPDRISDAWVIAPGEDWIIGLGEDWIIGLGKNRVRITRPLKLGPDDAPTARGARGGNEPGAKRHGRAA